MSNPVFIPQTINNNTLSSLKAMPLKDSTSDSTSDFELSRKIYERTYTTPLTNDQVLSALKPPLFGMSGFMNMNRIRPTVFHGQQAPIQKKWSANRDASQVTANRRANSVGTGSLNYPATTTIQTPVYEYEAILVGSVGNNYWSSDGITWNQSNMNMQSLDTVWTGSSWISTGIDTGSGVIATSTDGKNWTELSNSSGFFDLAVAVAKHNNYIVVMGESVQYSGSLGTNNSLIYSSDSGNTWNVVANSTSIFNNLKTFAPIKVKSGLLWNGNVWVGAGSGPHSLAYSNSANGSTWHGGYSNVNNQYDTSYNIFQVGTSLANNGNFCVGVGFSISGELFYNNNISSENDRILPSRLIAWSNDGISWTPATLRDTNNNVINTLTDPTYSNYMAIDVAFNGTTWIAICASIDVTSFFNSDSFTFVSSDGKNWTINPLSAFFLPMSIVWMGTQWIISGTIGEGATLYYSTDGINWDTNPSETAFPAFKLAWNGDAVNTISNTSYETTTTTAVPSLSFTNGNDRNLVNHALRRVRGGGAVAPPKKDASPSKTFVPSTGTHPYMQPGYKGKIGGYFPNSRYNVQKYQINTPAFTVSP